MKKTTQYFTRNSSYPNHGSLWQYYYKKNYHTI